MRHRSLYASGRARLLVKQIKQRQLAGFYIHQIRALLSRPATRRPSKCVYTGSWECLSSITFYE